MTTSALERLRSVLVVSGLGAQVEVALGAGADVVVADWEDLVAPTDKERARAETARAFAETSSTSVLMVRVNHPTEPVSAADVAALAGIGNLAGVVVPKADPSSLAAFEGSGVAIVPLIETGAGVAAAAQLASSPGVVAIMLGARDLADSLGLRFPPAREAVLAARSDVVAAGTVAGVPAIDMPFVDPEYSPEAEADYCRSLGFSGKICRTAEQVVVANRAFASSR